MQLAARSQLDLLCTQIVERAAHKREPFGSGQQSGSTGIRFGDKLLPVSSEYMTGAPKQILLARLQEGIVEAESSDRKSTRLNSSHSSVSRMPSSA